MNTYEGETMSPNQPKTPISGFRLDPDTMRRLRHSAAQMNVTMTEVVKRGAELMAAFAKAMPEDLDEATYREASMARHERGEAAVKALAAYIIDMEWPNASPRQRGGQRGYEASCRAAAILAGEAWAIRQTWPEAAYDIQTRSEWLVQ